MLPISAYSYAYHTTLLLNLSLACRFEAKGKEIALRPFLKAGGCHGDIDICATFVVKISLSRKHETVQYLP